MQKAYQINIKLQNFSPETSRKILVDAKTNFLQLHKYIQQIFGFKDCHLWVFEHKDPKTKYNIFEIKPSLGDDSENDFTQESIEPKETIIEDLIKKRGVKKLIYCYDFGADWIFDIEINESLIEITEKNKLPIVEESKGYMLIEDISPYELEDFVEMFEKKNKKEVEDYFDDWESFEEFIKPVFQKIDFKNFNFSK